MSTALSKCSSDSDAEDIDSYVDPAEFIFSNPEYQDSYVNVEDPDSGHTERVGVASAQLSAHSSVLREMLSAARSTNSDIHISDVSPSIFKLLLRFVYGGKLPRLELREAAQLALCAERYNVRPLLSAATEMLTPKTAADVFPALVTVTTTSCSTLERQVTSVIKQQTDRVVQDDNFLQINTSALLFILKQEMLNITEVELWRSVVRWGENQVKIQPGKTLREVLHYPMKLLRLLTLTLEEITTHVLPTKILTSDESVDLILAVTGNSPLECASLCSNAKKRTLYREDTRATVSDPRDVPEYTQKLVFSSFEKPFNNSEMGCKTHSNFTIFPSKSMIVDTFCCKTLNCISNNTSICSSYKFTCLVHIEEFKNGNLIDTQVLSISLKAPFNSHAALNLIKKNGDPLTLKASHLYKFGLEFQPPHPVYQLWISENYKPIDKTREEKNVTSMKLKFEDHFHVLSIGYKVKC